MATPEGVAALDVACAALSGLTPVGRADWPDAAIGRAAAFMITAVEGGALHLDDLRHYYDRVLTHDGNLHGFEFDTIAPTRFCAYVAHRFVGTWEED